MNDYRIVAKIKNNRIAKRIERAGFASVRQFCVAYGLDYSAVIALLSMHDPALNTKGEWRRVAVDLATALNVEPEELFNARQARADFETTTLVKEVDEAFLPLRDAEPIMLPSAAEQSERVETLALLLGKLPAKQRDAVERYYGIAGHSPHTFKEIGTVVGGQFGEVGVERARHIVGGALRRMRRYARAEHIEARDFDPKMADGST